MASRGPAAKAGSRTKHKRLLVELTRIELAAPRFARTLGGFSGGWREAPPEPPEIGRRFDRDAFGWRTGVGLNEDLVIWWS